MVLVMQPSLKEADRKKVLGQVKEWLGSIKITKEDDWGQKALAYPIKKEDAGYYYMLQLEGENLPSDMEQRVLRHENIIRHLLLRTK